MSLRAIAWVFNDAGTSDPIEVLVLLAIADHYNDETGVAFPSIALLAKKTRLAERALYRVLIRLKARALVVVEPGKGRRASNHYRLAIPAVTPDPESGVELDSPLTDSQGTPDPESGSPLTHGQGTPDCRSDESSLNRKLNPQGTVHTPEAHRTRFADAWEVFPRKEERQKAQKAYAAIVGDNAELHAVIVASIEAHAASVPWTRENGRFVPRMAKWLANRGWEDSPGPLAAGCLTGLVNAFGPIRPSMEPCDQCGGLHLPGAPCLPPKCVGCGNRHGDDVYCSVREGHAAEAREARELEAFASEHGLTVDEARRQRDEEARVAWSALRDKMNKRFGSRVMRA